MNKYTNIEIADDEGLWDEYFNTRALDPFNSNTFEERIAALNEAYPEQIDEEA